MIIIMIVANSTFFLAAQGLLAVGGGACLTSYTRSLVMVSVSEAVVGLTSHAVSHLVSWSILFTQVRKTGITKYS